MLGEVNGATQYISERMQFCLDLVKHVIDFKQEALKVHLRRKIKFRSYS